MLISRTILARMIIKILWTNSNKAMKKFVPFALKFLQNCGFARTWNRVNTCGGVNPPTVRFNYGSLAKCLLVLFVMPVAMAGCRRDAPPPNEIHSPSDLSGRMIGVLDGSASMRFADDIGIPWFVSSGEILLSDLRLGRIDAALMEESAAHALVSRERGVMILPDYLIEYDMHILVAKENAQLLSAVNSALSVLYENGTLEGLRNKYFQGAEFTYIPPETAGARPGLLTIAVAEDFPPYAFIDVFVDEYGVEHRKLTGLDVELARAVADIIGVEYYIVEMHHDALLTSVWFGHADLSLGWTPWDYGYIGEVNFSRAYARSVQAIIVRQ